MHRASGGTPRELPDEADIGGAATNGAVVGNDFSGVQVSAAVVDDGTAANDATEETGFAFSVGNPDPSSGYVPYVEAFRAAGPVFAAVQRQVVIVKRRRTSA